MREEYLANLEKALRENNISDYQEVYKKYEKRYDFGKEASLSDEEIEEKLGSIDDIIENLKKNEIVKVKENIVYDLGKSYNLTIKVVVDDVIIKSDPFASDISFKFEQVKENNYIIKNEEHNVSLTYKEKFFSSPSTKNSGTIYVIVPENIIFNEVTIAMGASDFTTNELKANKISIKNTSGDFNINFLNADSIELNNVSGDFNIEKIITNNIELNNVSGDFKITSLKGDLKLSNISGDILIDTFFGNSKISNISGDIVLSGNSQDTLDKKVSKICATVGKKVKGFFTDD